MLKLIDAVGVNFLHQRGFLVEGLERFLHFFVGIHKVQDEGIVLVRASAVKPGKGLDGFDILQFFIHDHGVEKRLIESGLILFCHDQHIEVVAEFIFGLGIRDGSTVLADIQA